MEIRADNLGRIWDMINSHWIFISLINLVILTAVLFLAYKYLFSTHASWLREKIPFLKKIALKNEVDRLVKEGEYAKAGDLLAGMRRYKDAVKVFTDGQVYGRAADIYMSNNQAEQAAHFYELAGDYEKAAGIYVRTKSFEKAEACFLKMDKPEEIPKMYTKHNLKSLAAQSFIKLNRHEEAAEFFAREGDFVKAGEMIMDIHKKERSKSGPDGFFDEGRSLKLLKLAGEYYLKAKQYDKAAKIFLEKNLFAEAAQAFELAGDLQKAAGLYMQAGNHKNAAGLYRRLGDPKKAAMIEAEGSSEEGDDIQAVKLYQEAGDFAKAGDIYRNMQEYEKAGLMFEKAKEYSLASSAYADAQIYDKAARCAEKADNFEKAVEYYGKAKDWTKQVVLQEKYEKFFGAGLNYYQRGLADEAIKALLKVKEDSDDYNDAISLMGKIYMEKGDFAKAREYFEKAVRGDKKISSRNLDNYTNLAYIAEQTDSEPSILKTIEKMLLEDLVEPDIKDKVSSLKNKLNYFAISRLSKFVAKEGRFAEPSVSRVSKLEKQRYIKIKEIGRGGMGIVYTAKDTTLDRIVALKILPHTLKKNPQAVKIFLREAKSAAALNHPNIVTVFDAGIEDEDYFIAMELINGLTIKEILKKSRRLSLRSVLEVLRQLLHGLVYAHKKNIVHRDLTTNNIMWSSEKTVKIMDFGLAKVVKDLLSEQSIIGGTPSFMSPEQTLGKPIDHRTDIYSLGICIFQMLTGELPFKKGDLGYHHLHTAPPVPKEVDKNIPDELSEIILRCMEKDPAKRFQNTEEIEDIFNSKLTGYLKQS